MAAVSKEDADGEINDDGEDDGSEDGTDEGDDDDDNNDMLPIFTRDAEGGNVIIEGGENGIIAVGNSEMEVRGFSCEIIPGTTSKGNAEIDVDCGMPSEDSDE